MPELTRELKVQRMLPEKMPDLTCLVPTHNRPNFLRRLLTFWLSSSVQGQTIVADSSAGAAREENEAIVRQFSDRLPLKYMHFELGAFDKFATAVNLIETPYLVISADDDFTLPAAVDQSTRFLRTNPEYICAQGMLVSVKPSKSRCRLKRGYDLSSHSPARRFQQMAELWFSTFYGVYRTDALRECYRVALTGPNYAQARIYPEFMLSQMTVLLGKVKFFPNIYGVWQVHDGNVGRTVPAVQDLEQSEQHFEHFRNVLAERLQHYSCLDRQASLQMIDEHFAALVESGPTNGPAQKSRGAQFWSQLEREVRRTLIRMKLQYVSLSKWRTLWHDPQWKLAHRLIQTYPQGMTESDLQTEKKAFTEENRAA